MQPFCLATLTLHKILITQFIVLLNASMVYFSLLLTPIPLYGYTIGDSFAS